MTDKKLEQLLDNSEGVGTEIVEAIKPHILEVLKYVDDCLEKGELPDKHYENPLYSDKSKSSLYTDKGGLKNWTLSAYIRGTYGKRIDPIYVDKALSELVAENKIVKHEWYTFDSGDDRTDHVAYSIKK